MKRKNKNVFNDKTNVQAVYLHKDGELSSANVGERGLVSIEMVKGSALLKMDNGQLLTIAKEEIEGLAVRNKNGEISTFAINKIDRLIKTRNEEKYEKNSK